MLLDKGVGFIILCNNFGVILGGVLMSMDKVITYSFWQLNPREMIYLVVICSWPHLCLCLNYGDTTSMEFIVRFSPILVAFNTQWDPNMRLLRRLESVFKDYDLMILYLSGKANVVVDALSWKV